MSSRCAVVLSMWWLAAVVLLASGSHALEVPTTATPTAAQTSSTQSTTGNCTLVLGLRVDGNDIGNASVGSAGECCSACTSTPGCAYFVFVASRQLCWLKTSGSGASRHDPDCTAGQPPAKTRCRSVADCNGAGQCDEASGRCQCSPGWAGQWCERLNLQASARCGAGGLCIEGASTWGGSVALGDDGKWHMFAALMANNCTLDAWLTNSRVLHAVAESPMGPYQPSDIALGPRAGPYFDSLTQHNPSITRAPDGTWLLFYMGSQAPDAHTANCSHSSAADRAGAVVRGRGGLGGLPPVAQNQRVGLATARSPYGPWTRPAQPVLEPGPKGAWDDMFVTNPAPVVHANGSILLVYKGRSFANPNAMLEGVAVAANYSAPFVRMSPKAMDLPTDCEDAGVVLDTSVGLYRMVLHCGCNYLQVWSADGLHWQQTTPMQPWCNVTYTDGGAEQLHRRERPKFICDQHGIPTHLATGVSPSVSHERRTFTMVTQL